MAFPLVAGVFVAAAVLYIIASRQAGFGFGVKDEMAIGSGCFGEYRGSIIRATEISFNLNLDSVIPFHYLNVRGHQKC